MVDNKMKTSKMRVIVFLFLVILLTKAALAEDGKIYFITLGHDGSGFSFLSIVLKEGFVSNVPGNYVYEMISSSGEVLETQFFDFPEEQVLHEHIFLEDGSFESLDTITNKSEVVVIGNYFKNGKLINIYDPGRNKILSIDVGHVPGSEVTGFGVKGETGGFTFSKVLAFVLPFVFIFLIMFIVYLMGREKKR